MSDRRKYVGGPKDGQIVPPDLWDAREIDVLISPVKAGFVADLANEPVSSASYGFYRRVPMFRAGYVSERAARRGELSGVPAGAFHLFGGQR